MTIGAGAPKQAGNRTRQSQVVLDRAARHYRRVGFRRTRNNLQRGEDGARQNRRCLDPEYVSRGAGLLGQSPWFQPSSFPSLASVPNNPIRQC